MVPSSTSAPYSRQTSPLRMIQVSKQSDGWDRSDRCAFEDTQERHSDTLINMNRLAFIWNALWRGYNVLSFLKECFALQYQIWVLSIQVLHRLSRLQTRDKQKSNLMEQEGGQFHLRKAHTMSVFARILFQRYCKLLALAGKGLIRTNHTLMWVSTLQMKGKEVLQCGCRRIPGRGICYVR